MTPVIIEAAAISCAVCVGFVLAKITGSTTDIALAFLFVIYFISKHLLPKKPFTKNYIFDSIIFTIVVTSIVITSGGLNSPVFFLIYFLLFGLGLLAKPVVSLTTALTFLIFFIVDTDFQNANNLTSLFSLPMITPFAMFLGNEFHRARWIAHKNMDLQENSFMFLSTVLKEHINRIGELADNFQGDHELEAIKRIVRRTQKLIEKFEKESIAVIILCGTLLFIQQPVEAVNMDSSQYRIKYGNINFGSKDGTSDTYDLNTTMGQLAAKKFSSTGYIVRAGFQYWGGIIPFTFSISDMSIQLGTLTPNTPSTAASDLEVSFGGAGQYQVTVQEIGTLRTSDGSNEIIDTLCNGGGQTCTETSANVWDSSTAYGFGYNMSGDDIPGDFAGSSYFRRFPNSLTPEDPAIIMSSTTVTNSSIATITYKANISNVQPAGSYQTVIRFVATPSF